MLTVDHKFNTINVDSSPDVNLLDTYPKFVTINRSFLSDKSGGDSRNLWAVMKAGGLAL